MHKCNVWKAVLLACCITLGLWVGGGWPLTANAQEFEGSGTRSDPYVIDSIEPSENPFPSIISDDDLESWAQAHLTASGQRMQAKCSIGVIMLTLKDGQTVKIYDSRTGFKQLDFLQRYQNNLKQLDYYAAWPRLDEKIAGFESVVISNCLALGGSEFSLTSNLQQGISPTKITVNNTDFPTSAKAFVFNNGIQRNTYLHETLTFADLPIITGKFMFTLATRTSATLSDEIEPQMQIDTVLHYVDEDAYRTATKLNYASPISDRSNPQSWGSTAAATALNISDLSTKTLSSNFKLGTILPYFSFPDESRPSFKFISDGAGYTTEGTLPTFEEAKSALPTGFVYVGDDIDRPEDPDNRNSYRFSTSEAARGNFYPTPMLYPDKNLSFERNYYFVLRQEPMPVQILKTDAVNNPLEGAKFDLYRTSKDADPVLVATGLTSDKDGKVIAANAESIARADLATFTTSDAYDAEKGIGSSETLTFLKPGTYQLVETSAPEGYAKKTYTFSVKDLATLAEGAADGAEVAVQEFTFANQKEKVAPPTPETKPASTSVAKPSSAPMPSKATPATGDSTESPAGVLALIGISLVATYVVSKRLSIDN